MTMQGWVGIEAVEAVQRQLPASIGGADAVRVASTDAGAESFSDLVSRSIDTVNRAVVGSHADLQGLASGRIDNLHQVLIGMEESRLSFQLMLQVRNRLLESYQELMRMAV